MKHANNPHTGPRHATKPRVVVLTTGYKVDVAEPHGMTLLLKSVLVEAGKQLKKEQRALRTPGHLYEYCSRELHYVAGQLRHEQPRIRLSTLQRRFHLLWEGLALIIDPNLSRHRVLRTTRHRHKTSRRSAT